MEIRCLNGNMFNIGTVCLSVMFRFCKITVIAVTHFVHRRLMLKKKFPSIITVAIRRRFKEPVVKEKTHIG